MSSVVAQINKKRGDISMKLRKCLEITKAKKFTVFIYPKGHIKESRGISETPIAQFDIERNEQGEIPLLTDLYIYGDLKVKEIIPCCSKVNIVAEVK